jgi:hypothetical protein
MPAMGSVQPRMAALLALAIAADLATAVGYLTVHRESPRPAVASAHVGAAPPPAPSPQTVNSLLSRRSRAVLAHDRAAFLTTVDPTFRTGQRMLFDNLTKLPFASWHESADDSGPAVPAANGGEGWTLRLTLAYRLRDFDTKDAVYTEYLTFARHGGAWLVSGDGTAHGLRDDPQIWNGPALTVVQGSHTLVLGQAGQATSGLRDIARRLDTGVGVVSGIAGDRWARRIVAFVPATEPAAEALAGDSRNLGDIAALATITGDAGGRATGADRVVITPTAFARLNALGRHVVLTHELMHVAMGGARDSRTPMWLIEGLADYAGYKGTGIATKAAGRELAKMIAAGDLPATPPDRAAFEGTGDRLSAAYEEAWLACRMIAERYGEPALVRLYRTAQTEPGEAGDPRAEDRALRTVLGMGSTRFDTLWRTYIRRELT